jgi:hypothetical protein
MATAAAAAATATAAQQIHVSQARDGHREAQRADSAPDCTTFGPALQRLSHACLDAPCHVTHTHIHTYTHTITPGLHVDPDITHAHLSLSLQCYLCHHIPQRDSSPCGLHGTQIRDVQMIPRMQDQKLAVECGVAWTSDVGDRRFGRRPWGCGGAYKSRSLTCTHHVRPAAPTSASTI